MPKMTVAETVAMTPRGEFTAEEFAHMKHPPCPVCGAPVDFARIDVTTEWHFRQTGRRKYIAGRWECPRRCNPITGERYHLNQSWEIELDGDGRHFKCSCGFEERGVAGERLNELLTEHPIGAATR